MVKQIKLKGKIIKPKIYSMVFSKDNDNRLYSVVEYTLEGAINIAKKKLAEEGGGETNYNIFLWHAIEIEAIYKEVDRLEGGTKIKKVSSQIFVDSGKSKIMKAILDNKDSKAYETIKYLFTESEIKLIEDKLYGKEQKKKTSST